MERQIVVLDINGRLALSEEVQKAIGLHPGSRVEISVQDASLVVQPLKTDIVDELAGMFAGGPSLCDDLIEERRKDEARYLEKYGW